MDEDDDYDDYDDDDDDEYEGDPMNQYKYLKSEILKPDTVVDQIYHIQTAYHSRYTQSIESIESLIKHFSDTDSLYKFLSDHKYGPTTRIRDMASFTDFLTFRNVCVQTKEELKKQFELLNEMYGVEIKWITDSRLQFFLNCKLSHFDFKSGTHFNIDLGKFFIDIEFHTDGVTLSKACTGYYSGNNTAGPHGAYHPHIKHNGTVCLGTYGNDSDSQLLQDVKTYNLLNIIAGISEVLNVYNKASVYSESIESWVGIKCPVCSAYIMPNTPDAVCEKSGVVVHKDCAVEYDGGIFAASVFKKCSSCGNQKPYWANVNSSILCRECVQ